MIDPSTSSYATAFDAYLLGSDRASASLQTDDAMTGGYLAPPAFVATVARELDTMLWFRSLCNVLPPTDAPKVTMPRRLTRPAPMQWTTELAPPAIDASYKLGTYNLTPHYMATEFEVSSDLLRAAPSAAAVLADEVVRRAGDGEEAGFLAGDGAGKPLGLFQPSTQGIDAGRDVTGDVADAATFRRLRFVLRAPYLRSPSLRWLLHPNAGRHLAGLKSSTGEPLLLIGRRPGDPDSIDGVAVAWSDSAPAGTGSGGTYQAGDYFGLLGDLSYYDVLDGLATTITRLNDSGYARRNLTGFVVRRKVDGCPRIAEAFVRLKVA